MLKVTPTELLSSYNAVMDAGARAYRTNDDADNAEYSRLCEADWRLRRSANEVLFDVEDEKNAVLVVYARQSGYSATVFAKFAGPDSPTAREEFGWYKTEKNLMRAIDRKHTVDFDKPIAETGTMQGRSAAEDILCGRGC